MLITSMPWIQPLLGLINIVLVLKKELDDDQAIGRGKGGLSTKIHATCDALGNPTGFHLTPGQAHDLQGSDVLMNELTKADAVLADKAYDADARMRDKLKDKGCIAVIPPKKNRVNPANYDKDLFAINHDLIKI